MTTTMSERPSILVLISGNGTNLQALIDGSESGRIPGQITHVISSSSKAYGLKRAAKANIPTTVHNLRKYYNGIPKEDKEARIKARAQFDKDLADIILNKIGKPSLIVCAGWMLILSPEFLNPLSKAKVPIINLHPALPGAFEGTHAIERSWEAGQKGIVSKGGCMIHYVIQEVDRGEPLVVKEIPVIKGESCDGFEARIHAEEHAAIVEGTVKVLNILANKS
ncbi:DEKNAAC101784 [Brettanomyces naardenensis]|uniref:Phosphoribosylglycinamide formyltransferase n=1 Tax=Brettanomyces naardenensis TaxID=13370 RepID=A0A448YIY8_BRENA|nr:DEKNAAC101784 [Brettanomyces naardenensis]